MNHSVLTDVVCIMQWMCNVQGWNNKHYWTIQPVKLEGRDEAHTRKWSQIIYYFICFPLMLLFRMSWKAPGLAKYTFQQGSIPHKKEISVQAIEILLEISYSTLWLTLQCVLQFWLILSLLIPSFTWWFCLFWFLYIDKHNVKKFISKGKRKQLKHFKSQSKETKLDATLNLFWYSLPTKYKGVGPLF